ncbi:cyclophilin-like fold protein [Dactylosporangium sp. AC04546]|uniref:cyclophilin-like fold protein n=1 Tax=Dactylosporangium sp. AC04546 TaxID=2862460 RepID=UPI001EDFC64F|nr:cyclophilin-like fold protein [Dactylosporangium sp. AC04546]WVK86599.1 cyclophilin-like fold protein [Dactylosporangium sp. AC04546]
MRPARTIIAVALIALAVLAGCTTAPRPATGPGTGPVTGAASPDVPRPAGSSVVRFTAGSYTVDATIGAETPAVREFLGMLPLTLTFEEFAGREKIGYLPRKLDTSATPGSDPQDGDLIYFVPWGNLGFYYNTDGIGHSDDVIHLGTYDATAEQLQQLEHQSVMVTRIR